MNYLDLLIAIGIWCGNANDPSGVATTKSIVDSCRTEILLCSMDKIKKEKIRHDNLNILLCFGKERR